METIAEKQKNIFKTLKESFGWSNVMQTPKIQKVTINVGTGTIKTDKKKLQLIGEKLGVITGQLASKRAAKKSIAQFKLREGQQVGYQVTLRGHRMNDFVNKLLNTALPRTRDFRGISTNFDEMGNYTLGIKDNTIFPETADDDINNIFGMAITFTLSSSDPKISKAYLQELGFPFKKEEAE